MSQILALLVLFNFATLLKRVAGSVFSWGCDSSLHDISCLVGPCRTSRRVCDLVLSIPQLANFVQSCLLEMLSVLHAIVAVGVQDVVQRVATVAVYVSFETWTG